ncbi:threonine synthase [Campylobacter vulpis]|uniref:Threonine synthase n=1 Tax=Campylobacter vulpis TaxID=1655500 RepID=A0A2G4R7E5_9BACT|nr:threonine synthase [Campylobacter vulpis]MBS4330795.1 threonine synthase [Campylobacter vulpis]MBS4438972.1 threonine synthase [Campylobacter vulpis]PHY92482.1 threonine synthase [Campylobacter vulpis]
MRLVESQDANFSVDFKEALIHPSTPQGGLYTPAFLPKFNGYAYKKLSYKDFALELIKSFEFGYEEIFEKALKSYDKFDDKNCPITLQKINEKLYINELYHGPTRAFKDMALQPFGVLLSEFCKDEKILILCATSGDTGPATLKSFENIPNIKVACIYPKDGTSLVQALQMRTMKAKNLKVFALNGDFDEAQKTLKNLLTKQDFKTNLKDYQLCAANSVNFGRILFQIIYHYYAAVQIDKELDIIVPSGNFGNALGAYFAKKMGAKIDKIKIASNANKILSEFFNEGIYDLRGKKLIKTASPAMDILISSNIERLLFDKFKDKRTKELISLLKNQHYFKLNQNELESLKEDFEADFCTDGECMQFIKSSKTLIDPHTATCFKLLDQNKTQIISSTAEWTKFTPSMMKALFQQECNDEEKDMKTIAKEFKVGIKPEILELFRQQEEKVQGIESQEIEQEILRWIKQ